jgi:hypothetical protein
MIIDQFYLSIDLNGYSGIFKQDDINDGVAKIAFGCCPQGPPVDRQRSGLDRFLPPKSGRRPRQATPETDEKDEIPFGKTLFFPGFF